MLGDFDIQSAAQEILSAGRIVETETLTVDSGPLDAGDSNALVSGDVTAGAVVRGRQSLLVEGSLVGEADRPCRIEVEGDVVVIGEVRHARITGRGIWIGTKARHCRLTAQQDIEIGGDLFDARIVAGELDLGKRKIEERKQNLAKAQREREFIEQQLRIEERRVDKLLKVTRVVLDFSIGQIVQRKRNRVKVDLRPFYKVVGEKTEEEIDRALLEFFAKAVVGLLTKANRGYIGGSPNRQKVFRSVVRSLHDLFFLTRKSDRQSNQIAPGEAELNALIDALSNQTSAVYVRGAVLPDIDLQFVLPDVEWLEEGEVSIGMQTARLTLRPGADADQREVIRLDTSGEDTVLSPNPEELQGISIRVHEGRVVWEPPNHR